MKPVNPYAKHMKKQNTKKTSSQNLWLILVTCILAAGSGWYLYMGDEAVEKLLSKVEISALGQATAADVAEPNVETEEKAAAEPKPIKPAAKKSWTEEEINLFTMLEGRKSQLDTREAELNKLEEELQKQKEGLEKRLAELEDTRSKISAKLDEKVKVDSQKVDSLVLVYSNMKPAMAAKVIEGINEELAVEVLAKMKNKSAAEILNLMDAEKAKKISEKYAGYREPAAK